MRLVTSETSVFVSLVTKFMFTIHYKSFCKVIVQ
jgi:hypothetical protein